MPVRLPILAADVDKHAVVSADIPCAEKLPFCGAICCYLEVELSQADVDEGIVSWDREHPYLIARTADGSCAHLHADGCDVYAHRPAPCRAFDCRTDNRIWRDFDANIPNPNLHKLKLAVRNHRANR